MSASTSALACPVAIVTTWGCPVPHRVGWTGRRVERLVLLVICCKSKPAATTGRLPWVWLRRVGERPERSTVSDAPP